MTRLALALLGLEADVLEQFLEHGLQPPGADILDLAVHLGGDPGERADAVLGEDDLDAFGGEQGAILLGQARRVSERMRTKSSSVSAFSSTRIGSRP